MMNKYTFRKTLATCTLLFAFGAFAITVNLPGQLALALEQSVQRAIDEELPSQAQLEELARVNRLVARRSIPAVVNVETRAKMPESWLPPELGDGFRRQGQGSGVIIDATEGIILTNNHVVEQASEIVVRLSDGRRFDASLVGADPPTDLAVIRIQATGLSQLEIGDSNALAVGDPVMTVGNPFGLEGTVSKGIVSAMNRSQLGIIDYEGFIQTDAVINPGNSGGPLVNMRAEIVGINTAIETSTGTFSGVGLAIPASRIKKVLPTLLRGEKVVRGYLGVVITSVKDSAQDAQALGWSDLGGVIVRNVLTGSPAEAGTMISNDILVSFNSQPLETSDQLTEMIAYTPPGEVVVFDVWRNKRLVSLQVVVGEQPSGFSTRLSMFDGRQRDNSGANDEVMFIDELQIEVRPANSELIKKYELKDDFEASIIVTYVRPNSQAERKDIIPGNAIVAINGQPIKELSDISSAIASGRIDAGLALTLRTKDGLTRVVIRPEN